MQFAQLTVGGVFHGLDLTAEQGPLEASLSHWSSRRKKHTTQLTASQNKNVENKKNRLRLVNSSVLAN